MRVKLPLLCLIDKYDDEKNTTKRIKYFFTLLIGIQVQSCALLWNIAEKQGNFYGQTHNVNFHNVHKISAIL